MKKLYLIVDEWDNDKNFVGSELDLIKEHFDVTVICNGRRNAAAVDGTYPANIRFVEYYKKKNIKTLVYFLKCLTDKVFYEELKFLRAEMSSETAHNVKKSAKISEIIRSYINGELFYDFLKRNKCVEAGTDAVYYTYWYFWKCFALTHHRDKLKKSKIITRTHEYDLFGISIKSGYQPFKHFMDAGLDKVVFISEHGRNFYIDKYKFQNSEKYLLCHLGTDNEYGIASYNKARNYIHIVSCSSIIKRKRVDIIIDALALIENLNITWTHFGSGELFGYISAYATDKLSSKSNIKYDLKGYAQNSSIKKYYSETGIDAFITTSVSEGNPVSVIEAMSFGIPVIATNICNMPNLIKGNGILISENPEPSELANAICDFADMDADEIMQMRNMSREIWEEEYRADVNNKAFVNEVLMKL